MFIYLVSIYLFSIGYLVIIIYLFFTIKRAEQGGGRINIL